MNQWVDLHILQRINGKALPDFRLSAVLHNIGYENVGEVYTLKAYIPKSVDLNAFFEDFNAKSACLNHGGGSNITIGDVNLLSCMIEELPGKYNRVTFSITID